MEGRQGGEREIVCERDRGERGKGGVAPLLCIVISLRTASFVKYSHKACIHSNN